MALYIDNLFSKMIFWTRCLFKLEPEGGGCVSFLLDILSGILANIISRKFWGFQKSAVKKSSNTQKHRELQLTVFLVSRRLVSFLESSEQISRFGAAFKKPPPKRRFLVHQQGLEPGTRWLRVSCSTNWAIGAHYNFVIARGLLWANLPNLLHS